MNVLQKLVTGLFLIHSSVLWGVTADQKTRLDFRNFDPSTVQNQAARSNELVGIVYPRQRLLLAFSVSGAVGNVPVKEGDQVKASAPLMSLEQSTERLELQRLELLVQDQSAVNSARTRLELHRRQLRNAQELYDRSRSISLDELTALRIRLVDLEADLAQRELEKKRDALDLRIARSELEKRTITAPVNGYIVQIKLKRGEWAQVGDPVIEVVDVSSVYIRFSVQPARAQTIKVGMPVTFDVQGQQGNGKVTLVSPVADPASGLVEVRVEADNPQFRFQPGLQARVKL